MYTSGWTRAEPGTISSHSDRTTVDLWSSRTFIALLRADVIGRKDTRVEA
jgi:hypothetical protein